MWSQKNNDGSTIDGTKHWLNFQSWRFFWQEQTCSLCLLLTLRSKSRWRMQFVKILAENSRIAAQSDGVFVHWGCRSNYICWKMIRDSFEIVVSSPRLKTVIHRHSIRINLSFAATSWISRPVGIPIQHQVGFVYGFHRVEIFEKIVLKLIR